MAVADRWHTKKPRTDPDTGKPVAKCREHKQYPSADHGKGDRWQVRWRDADGKQCKENFARKDGKNPRLHADARNREIQGQLLSGTYVDPNAGRETFKDFAEEVVKNRTLDPNSRRTTSDRLKNHVYPAIGNRELRVLARRPSLIQAMVRGWEGEGLAPSYMKSIMAHVAMVFACAIEEEAITKNPCKSKTVVLPKAVKRKITPWTQDQITAMRAELPRDYALMVDIGAGAGLRQGEIFGLSPDDIDFDEQVLHVRRQVKVLRGGLVFALPKSDDERTVPLEEQLAVDLEKQLKEFKARPVTLPWEKLDGEPRTVDLVFVNRAGKAIRAGTFGEIWRAALFRAGIVSAGDDSDDADGKGGGSTRENGMHALRHYFASVLLTEGESVKAVAEWMGHHSPVVTLERYIHLMPKSEERMRRIIGRALRPAASESSALDVPSPG